MKIATTTGDFGFYCNTDEERIRELHRAGFRYIDLDMYSFTPNCDYMQDYWQEAVYRIKNLAMCIGTLFYFKFIKFRGNIPFISLNRPEK